MVGKRDDGGKEKGKKGSGKDDKEKTPVSTSAPNPDGYYCFVPPTDFTVKVIKIDFHVLYYVPLMSML